MYNERLEKLIEMALIDGDLTEKEKQILFKKAEELGVDLDEFEMVLEAKLFEKQQGNKSDTSTPESVKIGDVKKCPRCKEPIPALSNVCPACGYVLNTESSVSDSQSLEALIENIENDIIEIKSFPKPTVISTLIKQLPIILILIGVILFIIATKFSIIYLKYILMIVGGACVIGAFFIFKNKYIKEKRERELKENGIFITEKNDSSLEKLKADFEKNSRTAKIFYGENKKVSNLIDEFKKEIQDIEKKRKKLMFQNWIVYGIICLIAASILFIPKQKSNYELMIEEIQEKLAELKTKEYIIDGGKFKTTGNFGSLYQITSTKVVVNIDYKIYYDARGYFLSIQGIKLTLNPNNKLKLKKEITKIKEGCPYSKETHCGKLTSALILEDENNNSVGIKSLELLNGDDPDNKALFYSESEEVLLSFKGGPYTKQDIDKLSNVKNFTISIIIAKEY